MVSAVGILRQDDCLGSLAVRPRFWIEQIERHAGAIIRLEHACDGRVLRVQSARSATTPPSANALSTA